jgi:integrase
MTIPVTKTPSRTVPIAETMCSIGRGFPDKLVIFKIPASSFWWVRYYTQKKILKKSTKTENKKIAIEFAKKFYEDILLRERKLLPLGSSPIFKKVADELIIEQEQLIERGERSDKLNINDRQKLEKDILPRFGGMNLKDITYKHLNEYASLLSQRDLKPATINNHLNLIHKVLALGQRENLIQTIPQFPKVKREDSPRGWFNLDEYELLKETIKNQIKLKTNIRGHEITDEMRFLVTFMVNTFLRPSDIKNLRHRNIQVVNDKNTYIRIQTDSSKTVNSPIVSMQDAVGIYKDLVKFQSNLNRGIKKEDFVFFPHIPNREFALQTMRRQFDHILDVADLKNTPTGEPRTLYSCRHSAIMFRLTMGESIDLLTLARNARTSVSMIERFYAKPLQGEMNIDKIQSMKRSKPNQRRPKSGSKTVR